MSLRNVTPVQHRNPIAGRADDCLRAQDVGRVPLLDGNGPSDQDFLAACWGPANDARAAYLGFRLPGWHTRAVLPRTLPALLRSKKLLVASPNVPYFRRIPLPQTGERCIGKV